MMSVALCSLDHLGSPEETTRTIERVSDHSIYRAALGQFLSQLEYQIGVGNSVADISYETYNWPSMRADEYLRAFTDFEKTLVVKGWKVRRDDTSKFRVLKVQLPKPGSHCEDKIP